MSVIDKVRGRQPAEIARIARDRAQNAAWVRETYVWYQLDLGPDRPRRELGVGMRLVRADADPERSRFRELQEADDADTERRLARGGVPWLVQEGDRAAFACWIFPTATPVRSHPGGWLPLPPGIVCLEDSVTSPGFRGRGVAPAAWSAIADGLEADGRTAIVTKILEDNAASRKAVEKVGFREVAELHLTRVGPRVRMRVATDGSGAGGELQATMDGRARWLVRGRE